VIKWLTRSKFDQNSDQVTNLTDQTDQTDQTDKTMTRQSDQVIISKKFDKKVIK
jgi:hypothetical protein